MTEPLVTSREPENEADPVCDVPGIEEIRRQLFVRWIPHYGWLLLKIVPWALAGALGLFFVMRWKNPAIPYSALPLMLSITTALFVILALWTLPTMLWLDYKLNRRLKDMARRAAAGEIARASEVRL
jgi:hypothetical protein